MVQFIQAIGYDYTDQHEIFFHRTQKVRMMLFSKGLLPMAKFQIFSTLSYTLRSRVGENLNAA